LEAYLLLTDHSIRFMARKIISRYNERSATTVQSKTRRKIFFLLVFLMGVNTFIGSLNWYVLASMLLIIPTFKIQLLLEDQKPHIRSSPQSSLGGGRVERKEKDQEPEESQ